MMPPGDYGMMPLPGHASSSFPPIHSVPTVPTIPTISTVPTIPTISTIPTAPPPGTLVHMGTPQQPATIVIQGPPAQSSQMDPLTTGYFGNLAPTMPDDVITAVLACCGPLRRFKRPLDQAGTPQAFALVEFETADGLLRAHRLLQDMLLYTRRMTIRIEEETMTSLRAYETSVAVGNREEGEADPEDAQLVFFDDDVKCLEAITRTLVGKKLTGSLDWMERRISTLKRTKTRSRDSHDDNDDRRRRKSSTHSASAAGSMERRSYEDVVPSNTEREVALRDRERRWETREAHIERSVRRDREKDAERETRRRQDAAALAAELARFDDSGASRVAAGDLEQSLLHFTPAPSAFYENRERWRAERERMLRRERQLASELELKDVSDAAAHAPASMPRMRAADFIQPEETRTVAGSEASSLVGHRKPLLAEPDLSLVALVRAGATTEEASRALAVQNEAKMRALVERIPVDRDDLFSFPVDWQFFVPDAFWPLLERKTLAHFSRGGGQPSDASRLAHLLFDKIAAHETPNDIVNSLHADPLFLLCSVDAFDADFLLMTLWRYLIYETEARAYNISK